MKEEIVVTVASAGPYANHLHLGQDILPYQHSISCTPDALIDVQPTASMHWRQSLSSIKVRWRQHRHECSVVKTSVICSTLSFVWITTDNGIFCRMVHLNAFQSTEVPQITVVLEKRPLNGCLTQLTVCLLYWDRQMFVLIISFRSTWTGWWKDYVCNAC